MRQGQVPSIELEAVRHVVQLAHVPALLQNWLAGQLACDVHVAAGVRAAARAERQTAADFLLGLWGAVAVRGAGERLCGRGCEAAGRKICMQTAEGDHVGVLRHEGSALQSETRV